MASQSEPILIRHIGTIENIGSRFPNDFQGLKTELEFMNHFTSATTHQKMFMQYFKGSIPQIQRVMLEIEKELVSLENWAFR